MRLLALAALVMVGIWIEARAGEDITALTVSIASFHFDRGADRCEINPGIGVEAGSALRFLGGLYHNSQCRLSGYLGLSYSWHISDGWRVGAAALALTGYHEEQRVAGGTQREERMIPAPALVLAYEGRREGVNLGLIPPAGEKFKGVLFLQWKRMLR